MKKTALYNKHLEKQAQIIDFGGWQMPIHYGSQIAEHNTIRQNVGMFDVSHMQVIDINGNNANKLLQYLLSVDITQCGNNKALYSLMLNSKAGVIDDLIVYKINSDSYRIVVNANSAEKDIAWIKKHNQNFNCDIVFHNNLAIIAIQGPKAKERLWQSIPGTQDLTEGLAPFEFASVGSLFIARTGYTGEDGFEIILPNKAAEFTWEMFIQNGVSPCGLGARDTLRLEAGMSLYGNEMDENTTPAEAGLSWCVDLNNNKRDFIGKKALSPSNKTIRGLILQDKGVLRAGQIVDTDHGKGIITSGTFSPTIKKSIALARVPKKATNSTVTIRGKQMMATIINPPFVRGGKILI